MPMTPAFPTTATRELTPGEAQCLADAVNEVTTTDVEAYRSPERQAELRLRLGETWPGWAAVLDDVRQGLAAPPHACLVRGVPIHGADRVIVASTCGIGQLVDPYRRPWSRLVREITPPTDRGGDSGKLNERLHTDGTDWPRPNDVTCLLCVRADPDGGGRSRLLPIEGIRDLVDGQPPDVRRAVSTPVPWAVADELGGGVVTEPVLSADGVRWLRFTIGEAIRTHGDSSASPPSRTLDALTGFEAALESSPAVLEFGLLPGDLLLVDNRRCLHARTIVANPQVSDRLVLRTKLVFDGLAR